MESSLKDASLGGTPRRGKLSLALLLLCLALGMRLVGIDHGLPHHGEPDAYLVQQAGAMISEGITDREFAGWKYPHLIGTIVALVPPRPVERLGPGATLEEHRELSTRLRKRGRVVVAVISSLAAPATYLIAARFLGARFAFLAGLLIASSLLHICFSVQARPHGPLSAFATLGVLCSIRWREKPSYGRALLLGLSVAATVSTLHSGVAALAPMGAAILGLLRDPFASDQYGLKRRALLGSLLAVSIVAISAGWFFTRAEDGYGLNPKRTSGAIAKRHGGLGDKKLDKVAKTGRVLDTRFEGERVLRFSGHAVPLSRFNGEGFAVAGRTLWDYDPVILIFTPFGFLGLGALALRRRKQQRTYSAVSNAVWITLAYGIPTFLVYGIYERSNDRFYLALMPVTCILAAFGMSWLWRRKIARVLSGAVIALGVAAMLTAAALIARLRVHDDTYTRAAQAIEELSADSEPLVYTVEIAGLPLMAQPPFITREAIWAGGPWDSYQWTILTANDRGLFGESRGADRQHAAAPDEAALRLGRRIMPAPAATRIGVFHAEDKAAVAQEALAKVDPDIVLINTSRAIGHVAIGPTAMRDAWKEGVRADGRWKLERTIENSDLEDHDPLGYRLKFLSAFRYSCRGPEIEVWTKRQ